MSNKLMKNSGLRQVLAKPRGKRKKKKGTYVHVSFAAAIYGFPYNAI